VGMDGVVAAYYCNRCSGAATVGEDAIGLLQWTCEEAIVIIVFPTFNSSMQNMHQFIILLYRSSSTVNTILTKR
jgi:hypothetical protein